MSLLGDTSLAKSTSGFDCEDSIDIRCIPLFACRRRKIFCDKWYTFCDKWYTDTTYIKDSSIRCFYQYHELTTSLPPSTISPTISLRSLGWTTFFPTSLALVYKIPYRRARASKGILYTTRSTEYKDSPLEEVHVSLLGPGCMTPQHSTRQTPTWRPRSNYGTRASHHLEFPGCGLATDEKFLILRHGDEPPR